MILNRGDEGCTDLKYMDKDGSAFNKDPSQICLNKKSIQEKVTRTTGMILATSLIGHELVHRMGGNEEEADFFQLAIQRSMGPGSPHRLLGTLRDPYIQSVIPELKNRFINLDKITTVSADPIETCLDLSKISNAVTLLAGRDTESGINRFSPLTRERAQKANLTARFLIHYCTKDSDEKRAEFENSHYPRFISYLNSDALLLTCDL